MSAIARMMLGEGKEVWGSDRSKTLVTSGLEELGAQIFYEQKSENITPDIDLIVYTIAIPDNHPELVRARELQIPCKTYPEMLGLISSNKFTIAVAGTHGKTTTTAMIAETMIEAKLDPTVIVGSLLKSGSNFVAGHGNYFVVEACEYRRSFLNLSPKIIAITNIDNDHLDYYKDLTDIQNAFTEFVSRLPGDGLLVCDMGDPLLAPVVGVAQKVGAQVIDYKGYQTRVPKLLVPGEHNRLDASIVLAIAEVLGVDLSTALGALRKFTGTWRRFEYKGETSKGAQVYDDYAHHPTEIRASLSGAREFMKERGLNGRLIAIFQPHLYSRTKLLKNDFARALTEADQIILLPIYAAREPVDLEINSDLLAEAIRTQGGTVDSVPGPEGALKIALDGAQKGDLLITIGAGDVSQIAPNLIQ